MADLIKYPASELDEGRKLLALVGSFWANTYQGNRLVENALFARAQLDAQTHLDLLELVASMSRLKAPVFHTDNWYLLNLAESQRNQAEANFAVYDGSYVHDGSIAYDVPLNTQYHVWQLPTGFADAKLILNRITGATVLLTQGIDFFVRNGAIWFRDNPFLNANTTIREVFVDGVVADRDCGLWVYRGQWDWNNVYNQFGYVLGLKLKSSPGYKALVNAVFDGIVEGTSARVITELFSAICDVPTAKGTEIVENIFADSRSLWIVTDRDAYSFHLDSTALVAKGDTVQAGDALTNTVQFFEFNRGQVPAEIRALSVGRGFLATGYFQDLVFENKTVDLVVEENVDGYTKVSFEIGGMPTDVEKFWDDVHASGVAAASTLAMLLDQRTNKTGQPTALALPRSVSPLGFLLQNIFRNNVFVVRLRSATFGANAISLHNARVLRRLVPPHTACIVLVELEISGDKIIMDGPGDSTRAGYQEDVKTFTGCQLQDSIDPTVMIRESVRCFQVSGNCQ